MRLRYLIRTLWIGTVCALAGCVSPVGYNLPPAERLMEPGPGVGGPGPGVIHPPVVPGAVAGGGGLGGPAVMQTTQVLFAKPDGLQVRWDVSGHQQFDSTPLVVPGRQNFPQGGIYQLKLTNIPGREGVELYPTLEIGFVTPRTGAYLAHNAIPVQFTQEDFDQVMAGNFVTKVIYLPDPEFQVLALAGVETLVSTRLDPGVDPIVEADRRGAIMAIVRLGNKDIELPGSVDAAGFGTGGFGLPGCYGVAPNINGTLGPAPVAPNFVAGMTAPEWGMPITGTPIGLPGPPHIPLGGPAGLKKHVMKNHTWIHMPDPVKHFKIDVKQVPGYTYPAPPNRMKIHEQSYHPTSLFGQPHYDKLQWVK